jgi:hypothetical protein
VKTEAGKVADTVHLIDWESPEGNDFALATDRDELDKQIKDLESRPSRTVGETFVFVDECHRTQSGKDGVTLHLEAHLGVGQEPHALSDCDGNGDLPFAGNTHVSSPVH